MPKPTNPLDRVRIITFRDVEDSLSYASVALAEARDAHTDTTPLWEHIDELLELHAMLTKARSSHGVTS